MTSEHVNVISGEAHQHFQHLNDTLLEECAAMAEFSLSTGKAPEPIVIEQINGIAQKDSLDEKDVGVLANLHRQLTMLISPATPNGIRLLQQEKAKAHILHFLGPVPLVRRLTLLSALLLVLMISVGLSSQVNYDSINQGILHSQGLKLLLNLLFLLSCAGLGACFSALYQLNQFIINANYDPKFDSTYWIKILLGVIAGLFMVELIPPTIFESASQVGSSGMSPASGESLNNGEGLHKSIQTLAKPAMALLGGFSATMVYRILQRLVDSIESFVKGDQRSLNRARSELQTVQLEQHKQAIQLNIAADLHTLQEQIINNDPDKSKQIIEKMLQQLNPTGKAKIQ